MRILRANKDWEWCSAFFLFASGPLHRFSEHGESALQVVMQMNMNIHFAFMLAFEVSVFLICIDGYLTGTPSVPHNDQPNDEQKKQEYYYHSDTESVTFEPEQDWLDADTNQPENKAAETGTAQCVQCCDRPSRRKQRYHHYNEDPPEFQAIPQINLTILKGEKGDKGPRGSFGKNGKTGIPGLRGPAGSKGAKGSTGNFGEPCKMYYAAFSVGRKKELHSNNYYQTLVFDTVYVNLYDQFNMFTGRFYCSIPGIYHFSLNVHTWNQKETYMHIMKNDEEVVILYAQPSDRSIMQSQSIMIDLKQNDEVWIRLFKGERENAIFSDGFDTYITFNGYLIKPNSEN
ncbi:complement C1q tumor necrosis factor-related protein 1 isoform X1 [Carcharodon carcharias]|uniref:complement C1q tumor necrosis factor-related protein 1 isoform X1 n=2 Tax=Carcharodon carcharias TaxID=13397 RepID=UPI001B7DF60C|nr:complement C1q tumor necrosis factor-related protein 1 isoform X1 [Carcharodon carcharias]